MLLALRCSGSAQSTSTAIARRSLENVRGVLMDVKSALDPSGLPEDICYWCL